MAEEITLLRMEEVASRLRLSFTQARQLVLRDKAIPHIKIGARGIRIKESDLEAYIKQQGESSNPAETRQPYEGRAVALGKI